MWQNAHDILPEADRLGSKNIFCPKLAIALKGAGGVSSRTAAACATGDILDFGARMAACRDCPLLQALTMRTAALSRINRIAYSVTTARFMHSGALVSTNETCHQGPERKEGRALKQENLAPLGNCWILKTSGP